MQPPRRAPLRFTPASRIPELRPQLPDRHHAVLPRASSASSTPRGTLWLSFVGAPRCGCPFVRHAGRKDNHAPGSPPSGGAAASLEIATAVGEVGFDAVEEALEAALEAALGR